MNYFISFNIDMILKVIFFTHSNNFLFFL